jgi:hypothetical protein
MNLVVRVGSGVSVVSMVLFIVVGMNVSIHQLSTLQGESITLFEAIREACIRRWSNIVFESDFKLVVDVLQTNHMSYHN